MGRCCCYQHIVDKKEKNEILDKIIKIEEDMFKEVNSDFEEKASCQDQLKTFRRMRYMSFIVLSSETLQSYYEDLRFALKNDRNLMWEKYARMDDLIPSLNDSPMIDEIIAIEESWLKDVHEKYPLAVNYSPSFKRYAKGELETYSKATLELYLKDLKLAQRAKENLIKQRYEVLYKLMGFKSLDEVEALAEKNHKEV